MLNITLGEMVRACGGQYVGPQELLSTRPTGLVTDSREAVPGCIFAAVCGARVDGHTFLPGVMARGALCGLVQTPPEDPATPYILVPDTLAAIPAIAGAYRSHLTIPLIAVVGSVGKTSAKSMLACVLAQHFRVQKTPANRNNILGASLTLLSVQDRHEVAVLETGIDHFGEMDAIAAVLRPDIIVYTNIAPCHLEYLGDLDGVLRAKTEALAYMNPAGTLVVNGDDPRLAALIPGEISQNAAKVQKLTFGRGEGCQVRGLDVTLGEDGLTFRITQAGYPTLSAQVPGYGAHLVEAALPAVAVARLLGLGDEEIAAGLAAYVPEENHSSLLHTKTLTVVSDCYNSSPKAVDSALASLAQLPGRRVAILGTMRDLGPVSEKAHRAVGRRAAREGIDLLVGIGDNAGLLCAEAQGIDARPFASKDDFFSAAPTLLRPGDAVLVKASHGEHFEEIVAWLQEHF